MILFYIFIILKKKLENVFITLQTLPTTHFSTNFENANIYKHETKLSNLTRPFTVRKKGISVYERALVALEYISLSLCVLEVHRIYAF